MTAASGNKERKRNEILGEDENYCLPFYLHVVYQYNKNLYLF